MNSPSATTQIATPASSRAIRHWVVRLILYALAHSLTASSFLLISQLFGMGRFEHPELPAGVAERVTGFIGQAMFQPVSWLQHYTHLQPANSLIEWLAIYFNGIIWGLPTVFTWWRLTSRSSRTPPALPGALFLALAISAPFITSAQAGPLSFFR